MTVETLKIFGEVGGFGGLILAALIYIFRDAIAGLIKLRLGQERSYRLLRMIIGGALGVAALGLVLWAFPHGSTPPGVNCNGVKQETHGDNSPTVACVGHDVVIGGAPDAKGSKP